MVYAIIQARMGSSRLPGKSMIKILNKPLIWYVLSRTSLSKRVDKVILATTLNKEDDELANYAAENGFLVYRGSEKDVLSRYFLAYSNFCTKNVTQDAIVRITGDCPLIDPKLIDKVIIKYLTGKYDYVALSQDFAEGLDVEIFSSSMLEFAHKEAKLDSEREHVAQFFHNNKHLYKMHRLESPSDDSKYRITVDELEDLNVIKAIVEYFDANKIDLDFPNIKNFLQTNQEIWKQNSHIIRNEGLLISLKNESKNVQ